MLGLNICRQKGLSAYSSNHNLPSNTRTFTIDADWNSKIFQKLIFMVCSHQTWSKFFAHCDYIESQCTDTMQVMWIDANPHLHKVKMFQFLQNISCDNVSQKSISVDRIRNGGHTYCRFWWAPWCSPTQHILYRNRTKKKGEHLEKSEQNNSSTW